MKKLARIHVPGLPGPRPVPFLGATGNLVRFFADPVRSLLDLSARYGDVVGLGAGDAAVVCAFGAEHNRTVLSDPQRFENFAELPIEVPSGSAAARYSRNLINLNGDAHKNIRRRMMPLFGKKAVDQHRDAVATEIEQRLHRFRPGAVMDAEAAMMEFSLAIMMRCLFGLDSTGEGGAIARLGTEALEWISNPLAMLLPIGLPGMPYARYVDAWERLEARIRSLIGERRRAGDTTDVLSLLIRAYDDEAAGATADDDLVAQAELFFIAGYETTGFTLALTLFLLSQHPDVLAWLGEELAAKLGGRIPTTEDLGGLSRLDCVVKESMRVLTVAPYLFMRRATEPFTLGGHALPARTIVCVSPLVSHRSPEAFPDPGAFRPRRWENLSPGPYVYLPFGAGPRLCLGAGFAGQSIRLVLAAVLQRAWPELRPEANVSRKVRGVTLGLRNGLPVRLVAPGDRPRKARVRGDVHDLVELPD